MNKNHICVFFIHLVLFVSCFMKINKVSFKIFLLLFFIILQKAIFFALGLKYYPYAYNANLNEYYFRFVNADFKIEFRLFFYLCYRNNIFSQSNALTIQRSCVFISTENKFILCGNLYSQDEN